MIKCVILWNIIRAHAQKFHIFMIIIEWFEMRYSILYLGIDPTPNISLKIHRTYYFKIPYTCKIELPLHNLAEVLHLIIHTVIVDTWKTITFFVSSVAFVEEGSKILKLGVDATKTFVAFSGVWWMLWIVWQYNAAYPIVLEET